MIQARDLVPHFSVTATSGERVDYASLWQRQTLLLVTVTHADPADSAYAAAIRDASRASGLDVACVVTADSVDGVPSPGVLVADQWGEVVFVTSAVPRRAVPDPSEVVHWLRFVAMRCPECEGESR